MKMRYIFLALIITLLVSGCSANTADNDARIFCKFNNFTDTKIKYEVNGSQMQIDCNRTEFDRYSEMKLIKADGDKFIIKR
jgi:hypothetical protein